jgi:hypothetical protein
MDNADDDDRVEVGEEGAKVCTFPTPARKSVTQLRKFMVTAVLKEG